MQSSLPFLRALRVHVALLLVAALVVAGCATRRPVPVEERSPRIVPPNAAVTAPRGTSALPEGEGPPAVGYTVKRGDTLHQIALDNGLDYRELAAWNNIENVNRIFPGQVLRLTAPGEAPPAAMAQDATSGATGVVTAPLRAPPPIAAGSSGVPPANVPVPAKPAATPPPVVAAGNLKTSPKAVKEPYSEQAVRDMNLAASAGPAPANAVPAAPSHASDAKPETKPEPSAPAAANPSPSSGTPARPATAGDADQLDWAWPAKGRIVTNFSETANLKGIDIAGTAGEPVRASAAGRVVYAGNGLRGYGKLIIIKHNNTYLSAYAHNRELLVKEGQQVTRGQKIAEMGNTDADQVKLHFEIRRHGKPMDPTKFLPPV